MSTEPRMQDAIFFVRDIKNYLKSEPALLRLSYHQSEADEIYVLRFEYEALLTISSETASKMADNCEIVLLIPVYRDATVITDTVKIPKATVQLCSRLNASIELTYYPVV